MCVHRRVLHQHYNKDEHSSECLPRGGERCTHRKHCGFDDLRLYYCIEPDVMVIDCIQESCRTHLLNPCSRLLASLNCHYKRCKRMVEAVVDL